jgi:hypothetical protein
MFECHLLTVHGQLQFLPSASAVHLALFVCMDVLVSVLACAYKASLALALRCFTSRCTILSFQKLLERNTCLVCASHSFQKALWRIVVSSQKHYHLPFVYLPPFASSSEKQARHVHFSSEAIHFRHNMRGPWTLSPKCAIGRAIIHEVYEESANFKSCLWAQCMGGLSLTAPLGRQLVGSI